MDRPDWVDSELYPFEDRWEEIAGAVIHYVDEGEGTPILMVHGNPTWSFLYREIVADLRSDFRCIAVDLPGFGLSDVPPGFGYRAEEHATVLAGLVQRLDLRDYVLFGQDWGGPVGLGAAGRDPGRCGALVLGNTWAWSMGHRPAAYLWSQSIGGVPGRWVVAHLNAFVEVAMRQGARADVPLDQYRGPFPTAASRRPTWTFAREVTAASDFLDARVAPALQALRDRPALLPWGDSDPVFRMSDCDRLASLLDDPQVEVLEGARHFIQEDAPEQICAAIRAWASRRG